MSSGQDGAVIGGRNVVNILNQQDLDGITDVVGRRQRVVCG